MQSKESFATFQELGEVWDVEAQLFQRYAYSRVIHTPKVLAQMTSMSENTNYGAQRGKIWNLIS